MVHEHPLAYLLGLQGIALLRAFRGEFDRAFAEARIAEIRALLDDESLTRSGTYVDQVDTLAGYRAWAARYDEPGNAAFDIEQPVVHRILDALPLGTALDAACGTGRHADHLAGLGHHVIGVDSSPDMLDRARARVPGAEFRNGDLERLPVDDRCVDAAVCALALTHLPDLDPIMAELARVLRPGGHLVVSDVHHEMVLRGSVPPVLVDGRPGRLPAYRHYASDYLNAAARHGLRLHECVEPRADTSGATAATTDPGPWHAWPWSLAAMVPEAARAANARTPALVIWHFQLAGA